MLGPVAWEAMSMATQQHYLVEISDKLEGIASGIEELLERDDDDKRGNLVHVDNTVARSRERLEAHGSLSASRTQELRDGARDAGRVWHQLRGRFRRHLTGYGEGETSREDVERSWEMLLHATKVMTAASGLLTGAVARQAAQLALPAPAPSALFIRTHAGGEVSVVVEPAAATAA